jgi:hypothetical protein
MKNPNYINQKKEKAELITASICLLISAILAGLTVLK